MARRSAYSTGFGSYEISKPAMPVSPHGEARFDWGRATAVVLCLAFWAGMAVLAAALV
ncbi:hypothetical protein [Caulobacter segnis]|jgi:hypothetical protein|uniref:hypothetical protein n=1 Tax=Caulobacter segnis TaxID=88688 RepID=UPI001CBEC833|nr:hypothetical protein [Caulobacter segnis]UAL09242.1 hypothetical protein K8940_15780 [Caulobacter segnis]